jgi:hypothetical protein
MRVEGGKKVSSDDVILSSMSLSTLYLTEGSHDLST